jgi:hypothetical protein
MRTVIRSCALVLILASAFNVLAANLAGITLPDTVQVGPTTLVLNGAGLRTKYMVKVYVAGLYLLEKSSDPNVILKADIPKRIVMHFVRDVSKNQLTDGFTESFHNNTPDAEKTLKSEIDRLFSALGPVKPGQEIIFTYMPEKGTSVLLGDKEQLTIAGPAFAEMLFSVWLGPKPPNTALKKGLLGQL